MWLFLDSEEPKRLETEYASKFSSIVESGTLIPSDDRNRQIEDLPFADDKEEVVFIEIPKDIAKRTYFII
jgi:hypothetical protein